jgi:tetratricopeptide (TPR) repeat protein
MDFQRPARAPVLQGWPMRLAMPIRLVVLAAAGLMAAGCGGSPPVAEPAATSTTAARPLLAPPRTIELPLNALPLAAAGAIELSVVAEDSIAVQFMQPSDAASAPRIRHLSATPDAASSGMIREPGAAPPEVKEPTHPLARAAPRSNAFVPISMPQLAPPAAATQSPQLAARPNFDPPLSSLASQPIAAASSAPTQSAARSGQQIRRNTAASLTSWRPLETSIPARPRPGSAPQAEARPHAQAFEAAVGQAAEISDRALVMTQRGLHYSARAELIRSLQLIAQALDAQQGSHSHTEALAAALTALEEASDFVPSQTEAGQPPSVAEIARNHRTALLRTDSALAVSASAAQQQYFDFAQAQLARASGGLPVASRTLYVLGRLHTVLAANDADRQSLHVPQAIAFQHAAVATDGANYLATNELGVLLARTGQWPAARQALLASVSVRPHAEGWHNLAVVHRRLGETDLARRAEHERDLVASRTGGATAAKNQDAVRWVNAPTLAASRAGDIPWRENAQSELAASTAGQRR